MISGPMPSPGITAMVLLMGDSLGTDRGRAAETRTAKSPIIPHARHGGSRRGTPGVANPRMERCGSSHRPAGRCVAALHVGAPEGAPGDTVAATGATTNMGE